MDFILNTNNLILLVMLILSGVMIFTPTLKGIFQGQSLTAPVATSWINNRRAAIVDLRSAEEFKLGHLARAKHLPVEKFPSGLLALKLDKANPVILVCEKGSKSASMIAKFKKEGFQEVVALEGGIKSWTEAGLPLVS